MWTDVKWQTIKEAAAPPPGDCDRTDRAWNCAELQLQRSRSERRHLRRNGTSDITEPDGVC